MRKLSGWRLVAVPGLFGLLGSAAGAQPANVRAWASSGQVWVVWEVDQTPPVTFDVYASAQPESNIAQMTLLGRVFPQEAQGATLMKLKGNATLIAPSPVDGVTYTLAPDEGMFVLTPHASASVFVAVVEQGDTQVTLDNRAPVSFLYDPDNHPVRPHAQFDSFSEGGYPYTAYIVWVDGRDDPEDGRPDFPVMGNRNRTGVPHVFVVTSPLDPLPDEPYPCVFAIHGGEGAYKNFLPGEPERANMSFETSASIVVTPNDSLYMRDEGETTLAITRWFGYVSDFDPFTDDPRTDPPDDAVIIDYTTRRVIWFLDWLAGPNSGYNIDPDRVSLIGHSMGGRGAMMMSRYAPERFAAVVGHCPPLNFEDGSLPNPRHGQWSHNLDTNVVVPGVGPIGILDLMRPETRISPTERDFCVTRVTFGKRDENSAAYWSATTRAAMDAINDSGMGLMMFWDEREHNVPEWDVETDDMTDGHSGPWPDIAQWVAPVKTYRHGAQYLAETYRASRSYPGFFNDDQDLIADGRQPDPGSGNPDEGDAWGTWAGYHDWDDSSLLDEADAWACNIYLTGLSPTSIDNAPVELAIADVSIRRPRAFLPPEGTPLYWDVLDGASGRRLQSGTEVVGSEDVSAVSGVLIPRDPARARLVVSTHCLADFDASGAVNTQDMLAFLNAWVAGSARADMNGNGSVNTLDFLAYLNAWAAGC